MMIKKFIGTPGVGKTAQLLLWAAENNIQYVLCEDPQKMIIRAKNLGIEKMTFLYYLDYYRYKGLFNEEAISYVVDDIDKFVGTLFNIKAYSESI